MTYTSGKLTERIVIQNRKKAQMTSMGLDGHGVEWEDTNTVCASVDSNKGMTGLVAGAIDSYEVNLVRMRWTSEISRRSRIVYEGEVYDILPETFHADRRNDKIQFLMQLNTEEDNNIQEL